MKWFTVFFLSLASLCPAQNLVSIRSSSGTVQSEQISLGTPQTNAQYTLLYSIGSLRNLGADARVQLELRQRARVLAKKILHAGDPDFYLPFRVASPSPIQLEVKVSAITKATTYRLEFNRWPLTDQVKSGLNHSWQAAMEITPAKTVFAAADEAEYIPVPGTSRRDTAEASAGEDWYRFEFQESRPKLIFVQAELTDRDQLPVNVSLYRIVNGKPQEYFEGEDPVTFPHEVQALPGNKFAPRLLKEQGTYYISVRANHPEYRLRTRLYDPPPYGDPQQAVKTAVDYILAAGDSWHANTPRRGGILDRVSSVHQETSLCVACHATHFPLRAQLYAARNGYPVVQRQQLQFLTERFYNNPRPFYGFEQDATWARMISAPANVLGRMSHLIDVFEEQVTGERRAAFHDGINGYLKIYYAGRTTLPPDETNGNTPLISAHEVAWYAWTATKDPRLAEMIATGPVKNTIDLCYQTLALADIDRARYKDQIARNAARILSLQRPDGQWSMRFEPAQPEVEFQTGHALWALQAAGVPSTNAQVAKGISYLLKRQQVFGGWMDPLQSFENFRTPFRETQMSVLALSSYFPIAGRNRGWDTPEISSLSSNPVELLEQLDQIWTPPSHPVLEQIHTAAKSPDALIRSAAMEALGRIGELDEHERERLADASKLVQRSAAWAIRQNYSRKPASDTGPLVTELRSSDDRTRWTATRVFAQHSSALAKRPELIAALGKAVEDQVLAVRMSAIKGLWQSWFWTADPGAKNSIEDRLLTALGTAQHPWVESNLHDAVYNLADENIRYLYNNWVPLLAEKSDQERAIRGRLAVESRLAAKFSAVLTKGSDFQKKQLLSALTEMPLRRADVYNLDADLSKSGPLVYSRIGNDIEQIAFFGDSRELMAASLLPLLKASDPQLRFLAQRASMMVRSNRFAEVDKLAGPVGPSVKLLLSWIQEDPEAEEVSRALNPPPVNASAGVAQPGAPVPTTAKLDEAYFRGYVEPILQKRGKDGYACVNCHATHTLFDGTFGTTKNVVDAAHPEESLMLRKPTSTSESEGITNSSTLAHGGGVRFSKGSPEYNTILEWIKGAKD